MNEHKDLSNWSVGELLNFSNAKTPLYKFQMGAIMGYFKNPNDLGCLALMRKVYNAWSYVKNVFNAARQISSDMYIPDFVQSLDKFMSSIERKPEHDRLRLFAGFMFGAFQKDSDLVTLQNKSFLENAKLTSPDIRAKLDRLLAMPIGEVDEALDSMPLIEKLKSVLVSDNAQFQPMATLPTPAIQITKIEVNVQGDNNGNIVAGNDNDLNTTK